MNRSTIHLSLSLAIAVACGSFCVTARAQQPPALGDGAEADEMQALKKKGDAAMDSLRFAEALAAYAQVYAETKNPALLYNQARAYQGLGDFGTAYDYLERFDREAPPEVKARVSTLARLMDEVRSRVTYLKIDCNVDGAEVVIRDRVVGTAPIARELRTTAGRALVKVSAEGYRPYVREVDLPGGAALRLDVELVKKDQSGLLVIHSNVTGADVWVDGRSVGQAPLEYVALAGSHRLRAEHAGYDPLSTSSVIAVGERKDVTLTLLAPPPLTARWWFWTGVGVVVVGAAITVVALTTERGPDSGTIAPGQQSAPLMRW